MPLSPKQEFENHVKSEKTSEIVVFVKDEKIIEGFFVDCGEGIRE